MKNVWVHYDKATRELSVFHDKTAIASHVGMNTYEFSKLVGSNEFLSTKKLLIGKSSMVGSARGAK